MTPTEPSTWIVSITERYGDLETITRHPVRARTWEEAMETGRDLCAFGMRSAWVEREDVNTWSYLGFEQAATVTDAVEVRTFDDVIRAMGGYWEMSDTRVLPEVGETYDLRYHPDIEVHLEPRS